MAFVPLVPIGDPLGKLVDDMILLRSKPAELRKAVRSAIAERGAVTVAETPVVVKPVAQRSAESINASAVFAERAAARNKQR